MKKTRSTALFLIVRNRRGPVAYIPLRLFLISFECLEICTVAECLRELTVETLSKSWTILAALRWHTCETYPWGIRMVLAAKIKLSILWAYNFDSPKCHRTKLEECKNMLRSPPVDKCACSKQRSFRRQRMGLPSRHAVTSRHRPTICISSNGAVYIFSNAQQARRKVSC